jgi:hypothetical protein
MRVAWKAMAAGAALVASGTMFACSLLVPADELQCTTADDCHARGPTFAKATCVANLCQLPRDAGAGDAGTGDAGANDPWGCLDQPSLGSDPSPNVNMPIVLYDEFGQYTFGGSRDGGSDLTLAHYTPQSGVAVTACSELDVACLSPISGPTTSNDSGIAVMTVPGSFNGFFGLSEPGGVPSTFYAGRVLSGDSTNGYPTAEISQTSFSELQMSLNIPVNSNTDAGPGIVAVTQFDCNDRHAAGVAVGSSPAPAQTVYLDNGLPSTSAKVTSADGEGVLVNVPPGGAIVTTTLPGQNNRAIGTANVVVRSGGLTLVFIRARSH